MATGEIEILAESVEVFNVSRKLPFEIKDFVKVSNSCYMFVNSRTQTGHSLVNNPGCVFACTEIRVFADAVSVPGPEVVSDAEEPQAEISAGDEDERIPL